MKARFLALAGAVAVATPFGAVIAQAGGGGETADCRTHKSVTCYERVQTAPDLYTTRYRAVMVKPGWWETRTIPAVYGTRQKRVMVTPGKTVYHETPAQWGAVYETRVKHPGSERWVKQPHGERRDLFHRLRHPHGHPEHVHDVMCKVVTPPTYETVEKKVMVAPAKRVPQHIAAHYEWVEEPYLIRPARTERVYHPPIFDRVADRILVKPAEYGMRPVEPRRNLLDIFRLRRDAGPACCTPAPAPAEKTALK
jgi:hypothetical protein